MQSIRVAVLAFDGVSLFHLSVPGMVLGSAQFASVNLITRSVTAQKRLEW
ncbi:putative AraC-family regulatory protein [Pseudomonas amygdali pv. lachrymans]|nr:putative AraC-family regulatory protein [Pseudomonas amygdali pv. lachrymans]RMM11475.1 putative AraC-family regulatory protein [Pseudomonas syringae]